MTDGADRARVLVVDDDRLQRELVRDILADRAEVQACADANQALSVLRRGRVDLILSDLTMPAMSGLQLLEEVRGRHADVVFVLVTAHGDERVAVRALREGAYDYIPKPFDNEEIRALVRRAREVLSLRAENARLRTELAGDFRGLIGDSPPLREVVRVIRRAAPTDATVLVTGESGTGKELVARQLHDESPRRAKPFVALNCSALPAELVESELFGHVKGAFTGADRDREGMFEAANGGTLFLDEIGDLAVPAQAKLLRALEERVVTRVGATAPRPVDVRVIAATNQPLDRMIEDARFREDLLYRLRVVTIELPPLRERREDLLPIAVHLVADLAARHGRPVLDIADDARRALLSWDWPGNVRELRNALERAVVMTSGDAIRAADLPPHMRESAAPLRADEAVLADLPFVEARDRAVDAFERAYLTAALERHGGNVSATARALGLHRQSLQKMLKRLEEQ